MLNDIFRYIIDEEDEAETVEPAGVQEPVPTATQEAEHETLTSSEDPVAVEKDAAKVDKEIEEKIIADKSASEEETAAPAAAVESSPKPEAAEIVHAEEAPVAAISESTESAAPEPASEVAPAAQQELQPEKPKDPEPTPAPRSPVKQAAQPAKSAAPAKPAAPAAPKTWANLAAAAHRVATPVVAPQPSTSATPAQPKATPQPEPAAKAAPAASVQETPSAPAPEASPAAEQQDEWTSVGDKRQQNKAQAAAGAQETPSNRAYIKSVHESIDSKTLRDAIEKFGELAYFDVNRPKVSNFYVSRDDPQSNTVNRTALLSTSRTSRLTKPPSRPAPSRSASTLSPLRSVVPRATSPTLEAAAALEAAVVVPTSPSVAPSKAAAVARREVVVTLPVDAAVPKLPRSDKQRAIVGPPSAQFSEGLTEGKRHPICTI